MLPKNLRALAADLDGMDYFHGSATDCRDAADAIEGMLAALKSIRAALLQNATYPADIALCVKNAESAILRAEG